MARVVLCLDFDGTLTNRAGSKLVFTEFYKSLQTNKEESYKSATLISKEAIQQKFLEIFDGPFDTETTYAKQDADILISQDALNFLKRALSESEVSINIITKNRADYIRHVLNYQGFSQDEIDKIYIDDTGNKFEAAQHIYTRHTPQFAVVCDDDYLDCSSMCSGLVESGLSNTHIGNYNHEPAKFNWHAINKNLTEFLQQLNVQSTDDSHVHDLSSNQATGSVRTCFNNPGQFNAWGIEPIIYPIDQPLIPASKSHSPSKNRFFNSNVITPGILTVGLTAGAIATGLLGVHIAAPIVLGVSAALAAILLTMTLLKNASCKPSMP